MTYSLHVNHICFSNGQRQLLYSIDFNGPILRVDAIVNIGSSEFNHWVLGIV